MIITNEDLKRITIIKGSPVPDTKAIPSCFGLTNPDDTKCYKKGKAVCRLSKSCLIYTAEFFDIMNAENLTENNLKSKLIRLWNDRDKLEEKLKYRLAVAIRTAKKARFKELVQPTAKEGTATYYAELFWLKMGGTISECAEYVNLYRKCNAYKL